MLFPRIERWRCQLQRRHIQLYQGETLLGQQRWQPGLPLAEQLAPLIAPRDGRLPWLRSIGFELDAPHVRYLLVPWPQGITAPAELRQYARMLSAEQNGESESKPRISFIGAEYGSSAFAAVLSDALFTELKNIAGTHRLRFLGCSTPFSRMLSQFGSRLPGDALFACINEQEGSFAARYQGHWHSVFNLNLPPGDSHRQLDIANRLAGLPPLERYVMHTSSAALREQTSPLTGTE
ncbi:TPA: hypothetical protein ACOQZT_003167 [Serratia odorifera]